MVVLATVSQKGGVGKTTVALNLAFAMARRGLRTLLVDTDPQGAIGLSLAGRASTTAGLAEWVQGGGGSIDPFLLPTKVDELTLMTAGEPPFEDLQGWLDRLATGEPLSQLREQAEGRFDLMLFDTAAGLGGATLGALKAADFALLPLQSEPLALRTVPATLKIVASLRDRGFAVRVAAVLLTMTQFRDETAFEVTQEAWSLLPKDLILEAHVPRDKAFSKASAKGVPVGLLRRRPPPVAAVFDHVAAELEPRLGLSALDDDDDAPIHLVD